MKKFLCILLVLLLSSFSALAEAIDTTGYTYEELLALQEQIAASLEAAETQYAIENGNRQIVLDVESAMIFKGKTLKLAPTVRRMADDAPEKTTLVYTSSDPKVAKVSSNGAITAVAAGDCVITCSAKDDEHIFATLPVHVALKVSSVTLDAKTATLLVSPADPKAAQMQLTATVAPENAHVPTVTWTSSDESIATVDANGSVQAHAPGTVTITAASDDEVAKGQKAKSASCKITVLRAVDSLVLSQDTATLYNGETLTLTAAAQPEDASKQTVTWESSDPEIAAVTAKGAVKGVKAGTATITATANDGSGAVAACQVQVVQHATGVEMSDSSAVLMLDRAASDARIQLSATVEPDNAHVSTVTWKSSDESIATVTATSDDEPAKGKKAPAATCKVEVRQPVMSLRLSQTELTMNIGSTKTLKATALPETATLRTVTWESSDPKVVTVSSSGQMTAKSYGTAVITATAKDGSGVQATCVVHTQRLISGLKFKSNKIAISVGQTISLPITITPANTTGTRLLQWSSSNPLVASVSQALVLGDVSVKSGGQLIGYKPGQTIITARSMDGSNISRNITVVVEPVNGVEVISSTRKLYSSGLPRSITFKFRNDNAMRTIKSIGYELTCYNAYGDELGSGNYKWNCSVGPRKVGTVPHYYYDGLSYAQRIEIEIYSITYSDGTKESIPAKDRKTFKFHW